MSKNSQIVACGIMGIFALAMTAAYVMEFRDTKIGQSNTIRALDEISAKLKNFSSKVDAMTAEPK